METFVTATRHDFKWPYPKPVEIRSSQPPIVTKPKGLYMKRPLAAYCHCDSHQYDFELNQYKQLAEKEKILVHELAALQKKVTGVGNGILDHPCDNDDDKLKSMYQADYVKRGIDIPQYKKIMASTDSKAADIIKSQKTEVGFDYRDPTRFRYRAISAPVVGVPDPITLKTTPEHTRRWFCPFTGRTEYQDTISRGGLNIIKSSQQYKEPHPSTRRRLGDLCC